MANVYGSIYGDYVSTTYKSAYVNTWTTNYADNVYMYEGNDTVLAGGGNDYVDGWYGDDTLYGDAGNDTLLGYYGNDKLYGGADHDSLYGESGNDYLDGWTGDDKLYGGDGNDTLLGYDGYDKLYGGAGDDSLYGENGPDDLYGGTGVDKLHGGSGADYFYFAKYDTGDIYANKADTIYDFKDYEGDKIWLNGVSNHSIWQKGSDWVVTWYDNGYHDILVKGSNPTGDVHYY